MNKKIFDLLLMLMILAMFLSGYYLGEKMQFDKTAKFYQGYIEESCACSEPIKIEEGKIVYIKKVNKFNFSGLLLE